MASSLRDGGLPATQWPPNDGGLWRREVPWWLGGVSSVLPSNFARRPRPKSRTGRVNWRRRHALDAAVPGRGKCVAPEKRPQVGRTSRRPGYSFLPTTRAADHARSPEWTALEARRPCGSFEPLAAAGGCFGTSGRRAQFGALSSSQNACLELRSDFSQSRPLFASETIFVGILLNHSLLVQSRR